MLFCEYIFSLKTYLSFLIFQQASEMAQNFYSVICQSVFVLLADGIQVISLRRVQCFTCCVFCDECILSFIFLFLNHNPDLVCHDT